MTTRSLKSLLLNMGIMLTAGAALADPPPAGAQPRVGSSTEIKEDGSPTAQVGPGTMALLKSLEDRHGKSDSIEGTFRQTKTSEVFMEKIDSTGRFKFKRPDLFRADYDAPDKMTNLIQRDAIYVYVPELKQVERYKFRSASERDQQLHIMTLGLGFRATDIVREYRVSSSEDDPALAAELKRAGQDPAKLALLLAEPRQADADTSPFNRIKLWIDKASLRPQKIWTKDVNQDQTEISILNVKFNAGLAPSVFEPKFPPGTAIIEKADQ